MFRIDNATSASSAPAVPVAGTERYFTNGDPGTGTPATIVDDWWLNMVQEELRNVIVAGGLTPDKTDNTQLAAAIAVLVAAGGLTLGVAAGNAVQVDQAVTATTRAATAALGTSLNHTLSDTSATITAFNGVAGVTYHCRALGAGQITHHATDLIITQTGANITTAAGDTFDVEMLTATTCRIKNYVKADGTAVTVAAKSLITAGASVTMNPFTGTTKTSAVAHGLGGHPDWVYSYAECIATDAGYSVGQRIILGNNDSSNEWDVVVDDTNIYLVTFSNLDGSNFTTPAGKVSLTASKWKIVAVPYKFA